MAKNPNSKEEKNEGTALENVNNTSEENKDEIVENKVINTNENVTSSNEVNNTVNDNNVKEDQCKCCNDGCKCGDCNKCCTESSCNCVANKPQCCAKKCVLILALAACIMSVIALNKVNKICTIANSNNNIEDKIKTEVKEVITKNPQLVLDAISNGLVNKRDNIMEQSALSIENNKADIIKLAIRVGDANAKFVTICFFDPAGTPCKEAQKVIAEIVKQNNKKMCFYLLPVSILGDKSEKLAKVYYQLQAMDKDNAKKSDKNTNKFGDFLQEIAKDGATIDKVLDLIKVNKHELKKYEDIAKSNLNKNTELLEKLKVASLPAIFVSNQNNANKKYEVIHKYSLLSKLV